MNPMFNSLSTEKKERILNAAIKEFVANGFDRASTNVIVKNAGISKGSLFHYFNNKRDLFLYVIDYSKEVVDKVYEKIDFKETDLFKRMENLAIEKLHIQKNFPHVFDFLACLIQEESEQVKALIRNKIDDIYENGMQKVYEGVDFSRFRADIEIEKAIEIMEWTMLGFREKALREIVSFSDADEFGKKYLKEWEEYVKILKHSFYK